MRLQSLRSAKARSVKMKKETTAANKVSSARASAAVIPGRLEEANPEFRDTGFDAPHRPGMTIPSSSLTAFIGFDRSAWLFVDQRAGALVGEQLEQHRVRHLAVEDDNTLHALLERVDARLDLGNHAAGNRAVRDQIARVLHR